MSLKGRRKFLFAALSLTIGLVIGFGGCRDKPAASSAKTVRIGTFSTAIDYSPFLIAKSKGWFDEALKPSGVTLEYSVFQSLAPINESLAADRVDVMFMAEPPVLIGRGAAIDTRIVAMSCSLPQEILVPTNSSVQTVKELKGKKVAVLAGSSSHYSLNKIALAAGLKSEDIEVVDMVPPDAKAAFRAGHVVGWAVWPPWVEQEIIDGTGRVIPGSDAKVHSIMAMRGKFVDQNPEIARKIVGVLERARAWVKENPTEAKALIAKELSLNPKVIELAWPKHDWSSTLSDEVIADIQAKADFLLQRGSIRNAINVKADVIKPIKPE